MRAGLLASLTIILFSSFGHVYIAIHGSSQSASILGRANVLAAIWAAAFILIGWTTLRIIKDVFSLTVLFNLVSLLLIISQLIGVILYIDKNRNNLAWINPEQQSEALPVSIRSEDLPDIYYIILDEYGRQDVLEKYYDYDNSGFITFLKDQGFYVAADSHANYPITFLSVCSALNFDYMQNLFKDNSYTASSSAARITDLIDHNRVRSILEANDYQTISFATMYSFTDTRDTSVYYAPSNNLSDFESVLLESTALTLASGPIIDQQYRNLIINDFTHLKRLPSERSDQPRFIFVHMLAAHVPFVFGPQGESVPGWYFGGSSSQKTYVEAYRDQVSYINLELEDTITTILKTSKRNPVIIIQSDHGPQSKLNWYSIEKTELDERMGTLNAYYLPGHTQSQLYPSISPVNSFRVILNTYFGANLSLLEDRSYFAEMTEPLTMIDVTDRLK